MAQDRDRTDRFLPLKPFVLDVLLEPDALAHLTFERLEALVAEYHRQRGW